MPLSARIYHKRADILCGLLLGTAAGVASWLGARSIDPVALGWDTQNCWFKADLFRVFGNMVSVFSNHSRTNVHPLFPLVAFPPVQLLQSVFGLDRLIAVRAVFAGVAAAWGIALFVLLRLIGCKRFDAVLFTLMGMSSAAAIFWFTVPETYSFGSLTIVLALVFAVLTERHRFHWASYVVVSALTLSITVTNWMAGVLATVVNHRWRRSLLISAAAVVLVVGLWAGQKLVFRSAAIPLSAQSETRYMLTAESGGPWHVLRSLVAHTMVMPSVTVVERTAAEITISDRLGQPAWPVMLTQPSAPGSAGGWGVAAVVAWTALLVMGVWGLLIVKRHARLRLVLALTLLGQLALHVVYGDETFLYSLHIAPLLVALAAFASLTPARPWALLLAGAFLLSAGANNIREFGRARDFYSRFGPRPGLGHREVLAHMRQRPSDPWPRSVGHVVLGQPGSPDEAKAYHEPGGNFSPAFGSFGISIWLLDARGAIRTTSETLPNDEVEQQFVYEDTESIPSVATRTPYYHSRWSMLRPGTWQLHLRAAGLPRTDDSTRPALVVRSVGPAGGPVRTLRWDGHGLLINERWRMTPAAAPVGVYLGDETTPGWSTERSAASRHESHTGWGYARLEFDKGYIGTVIIEDVAADSVYSAVAASVPPRLDLDMPDARFAACLHAQVAHLLMGIVNHQTRPGDPNQYLLPRQRDGCYVLAALARAGRLATARKLAIELAEHDFFCGLGPRADAPGLSLWALSEVALQVRDPAFDEWLWPHVRRKVGLILRMLGKPRPIAPPAVRSRFGATPLFPCVRLDPELGLLAEPARNGLIVGKADGGGREVFYVNAASYRGLLDAAALAQRTGHPAEAAQWRSRARQLRIAWERAFEMSMPREPHAFSNCLWPSWVAATKQKRLHRYLLAQWMSRRDSSGRFLTLPSRTCLDIAHAHQWLFLGRPERAWPALRWFWDNQSSPGLYTWWEPAGPGGTDIQWSRVRGWVDPPHVTPHYWSAAEMLMLQLDMLAYVEPNPGGPTLVIGAGIPRGWLGEPMRMRGLVLQGRNVDWAWDGRVMRVRLSGDTIGVRLGPAFPCNTPVEVQCLNLS